MCGIVGLLSLKNDVPVENLERKLQVMNKLIMHRGPDGEGQWCNDDKSIGFAHRRLSIIDLSPDAAQPMRASNNTVITYNGEIYNYLELADRFKSGWGFKSSSDTETILAAYAKYGTDCVNYLRGMFAFAIWDENKKRLFCARDRFGIKPFYYTIVDGVFAFASEPKALLPLLPDVRTDVDAFAEYITFQYTIGENTLFDGIKQLLPGHMIHIENGQIKVSRYWDVNYNIDYNHTSKYFHENLQVVVDESIKLHLRSDVPIGSYLSGGIDSSLIAILSKEHDSSNSNAFHGKFTEFPGYDESNFAALVSEKCGNTLHQIDITADDFYNNIEKVIYHLDSPVAGPGSFPQFMVSKLASEHVKVVLGGQGGDEIFGGYARYVVAYFEQAIKAAIDGTYKNGNFIVSPESIIPNLGVLREYKPLIREFWRDGLFEELDARYFRLVDRSTDMKEEIKWDLLNMEKVYEDFRSIFNNTSNVRKESYFDSMTHFDFKCLLPALLQVEDRMSMAHGLESRVPFLDEKVVEFAATIPADVKFKDGNMKQILKHSYKDVLPDRLLQRRDKMGFPVPLREWFSGELKNMVGDIFSQSKSKNREFINHDVVLRNFDSGGKFSRKTWGLLSLELWQQQFHDQAYQYRALLTK